MPSSARPHANRGTTIFFFEGERRSLSKPRSALAGFRALVFGGALLLVLTVALQPALDRTGCSNYGGNGNGTAFSDGIWDLIYPSLLFSWMLAVLVEQFVPLTWNGRKAIVILARALLALAAVVIVSCGAAFQLLLLCR